MTKQKLTQKIAKELFLRTVGNSNMKDVSVDVHKKYRVISGMVRAYCYYEKTWSMGTCIDADHIVVAIEIDAAGGSYSELYFDPNTLQIDDRYTAQKKYEREQ